MPRKKSPHLPPVTEQDLIERPEQLRRPPNGGFAWACHYCGRYASSVSSKGRFLCRFHGGTTPRQRDPVVKELARRNGEKVPRPSGRPVKHGLYSRVTVPIDEIMESRPGRRGR